MRDIVEKLRVYAFGVAGFRLPEGTTDEDVSGAMMEGAEEIERLRGALRYGFDLYGYDGPDGPWPLARRHEFDRLARAALNLPPKET